MARLVPFGWLNNGDLEDAGYVQREKTGCHDMHLVQ